MMNINVGFRDIHESNPRDVKLAHCGNFFLYLYMYTCLNNTAKDTAKNFINTTFTYLASNQDSCEGPNNHEQKISYPCTRQKPRNF